MEALDERRSEEHTATAARLRGILVAERVRGAVEVAPQPRGTTRRSQRRRVRRARRDQAHLPARALATATVLTSARKFREEGSFKTYWRMMRCLTRYFLGAPPQRLASIYYEATANIREAQDAKI